MWDVRGRIDVPAHCHRGRKALLLLLDNLPADVPRAGEGAPEAPDPRRPLVRPRDPRVRSLARDGVAVDPRRVDAPAHGGHLPARDPGPVRAGPARVSRVPSPGLEPT